MTLHAEKNLKKRKKERERKSREKKEETGNKARENEYPKRL